MIKRFKGYASKVVRQVRQVSGSFTFCRTEEMQSLCGFEVVCPAGPAESQLPHVARACVCARVVGCWFGLMSYFFAGLAGQSKLNSEFV